MQTRRPDPNGVKAAFAAGDVVSFRPGAIARGQIFCAVNQ